MTLSLKLDTASPNFLFFDSTDKFILNLGGSSLRVSREDAQALADYINLKNEFWRQSELDAEVERLANFK